MTDSWHKIVVSSEASAEEAITTLDAGGLRLVLVIDAAGHLVGTLTDGDIRRALLRRVDFANAGVAQIMHERPVTAAPDASKEVLRKLIKEHSLLHIPLVDGSGRLVGLETYSDLLETRRKDNWVFLMAGGQGTRLRPLTENVPKPMLPVGGKPMLQSILEGFIAAGFHQFFIAVNYLAAHIKSHFGNGAKWGVTIKYLEEDQPLGTGGALGLLPGPDQASAADQLPIIVMNGDILTRLDFNALLDFHNTQQSWLTLCVREYEMQVPFGVVEGQASAVMGITEKPVHRFFVNAGIYILSPAALALTRPVRRLDMPDLVKEILAARNVVSMFPIREYWLDIGKPEDFERAQLESER